MQGGVTILDKTYDTVIVLKTALSWHKNRHVAQWNKTENPTVSAHNHCHLIFDENAQNSHWIKESIFNKWWLENRMSTCRRMKLGLYL